MPTFRAVGAASIVAVLLGLLPGNASAQEAERLPFDHIHLRVPNPAEAFLWYYENFGGTVISEASNRLRYGSTRLMFLSGEADPSQGSAIDHIGFSVPDIEEALAKMEANGVEVTAPVRDIPGLFRLAFVEDPWGTRIEVVEDPELLGLHHIHLRSPDPSSTLAWLEDNFGGERRRLKDRIDAMFYTGSGFSDVWVLVQEGEATPSTEHSIDHVGWRVVDLDGKVHTLEDHGVEIVNEPRFLPLPDNTSLYYSYVAGPAGARLELVQRFVED